MSDWQWTVYLDNGKRINNTKRDPEDVHPFGVQCIVQRDSPDSDTLVITAGDDFYYYDYGDERWYGVELTGLVEYFIRQGDLKLGRFIPMTKYQNIMKEAEQELERRLGQV